MKTYKWIPSAIEVLKTVYGGFPFLNHLEVLIDSRKLNEIYIKEVNNKLKYSESNDESYPLLLLVSALEACRTVNPEVYKMFENLNKLIDPLKTVKKITELIITKLIIAASHSVL